MVSKKSCFLMPKASNIEPTCLPTSVNKIAENNANTCRPIIKIIIKNEVPEPQKTLSPPRKNYNFADLTKLEYNQTNFKRVSPKAKELVSGLRGSPQHCNVPSTLSDTPLAVRCRSTPSSYGIQQSGSPPLT